MSTQSDTYKIGRKNRHITIPEGWHKVTEGKCLPGDMWCHVGDIRFCLANEHDTDMPFDSYDLLIRETL